MSLRKPYFKAAPGDPLPLAFTVERTVRFEEVDGLGIVWHGRYPSYLEDARVALGDRFGIGYRDFVAHRTPAPIKKMHLDYVLPLRFGDRFTIEARLHWSDAVRLNHDYLLRNEAGEIVTTGYTVQLLLDETDELLLAPPEFMSRFMERWRHGEFA